MTSPTARWTLRWGIALILLGSLVVTIGVQSLLLVFQGNQDLSVLSYHLGSFVTTVAIPLGCALVGASIVIRHLDARDARPSPSAPPTAPEAGGSATRIL